jgi:AcrR family transcriptional regulator
MIERTARNSQATRQLILDAVGRVLIRDGFQGLGINAIAKEAGVGKPLIYRYFGGLPPLLEEFGRDADFWLGLDDILAEADRESGGEPPNDYSGLMRLVLLSYTRILRRQPLMQEILASELSAPPELIAPLGTARRDTARAALEDFIGNAKPPEGVDAEAVFAILLAGFMYLSVRHRVEDQFWGIPIETDEEWQRFEKAMTFIVERVFSDPGKG